MSEYTEKLSRDYVHSACNGVTCISGDDYVIIECAFRRVTHTFCVVCNRFVPLDEVKWVDSGQRISDYRKEIAASVTYWQKLRLMWLANAYEGALRLHLDAKGNPKPGETPICLRPEVVSKCRPSSEEHVAVVAATQELTSALLEVLPSHFARIRCDVCAAVDGQGKPFTYSITNPDRPSEVLEDLSTRVGQAISRLVQVLNPSGSFRAFTVNMERKSDGKWRNLIELAEA